MVHLGAQRAWQKDPSCSAVESVVSQQQQRRENKMPQGWPWPSFREMADCEDQNQEYALPSRQEEKAAYHAQPAVALRSVQEDGHDSQQIRSVVSMPYIKS